MATCSPQQQPRHQQRHGRDRGHRRGDHLRSRHADNNYATDDPIEVTVTFGTAMTVDTTNGMPRIELSLTASPQYQESVGRVRQRLGHDGAGLPLHGGRGRRVRRRRHRDLTNTLEFNGGTIEDSSNTAAVLVTTPRWPVDAGHRVNFAYPALDERRDLDGRRDHRPHLQRGPYAKAPDTNLGPVCPQGRQCGSDADDRQLRRRLGPHGDADPGDGGDRRADGDAELHRCRRGPVRGGSGRRRATMRPHSPTRLGDQHVAPIVSSATVDGTSLVITFDEDLAAAASLVNGAFTVKKTPGRAPRRRSP